MRGINISNQMKRRKQREDEFREALLRERISDILQVADGLAEWTDVFNCYINYLLLLQHPNELQIINVATIIGIPRRAVASATLSLIATIESTPGGEHIPRSDFPYSLTGARLDRHLSLLVEQAALPPEWVPSRYGRPAHQDPDPNHAEDPNPAEDLDTSNPEDQS
jgi:hypothetical protein